MSHTFAFVLSLSALLATSSVLADRPNTTPAARTHVAGQLKWITDYGLALASCRAQQKPLLVILEKPETPAFKILPTTLITQDTNAKMLANYTLCRVDVTTDYGRSVADCFQAQEFPYTAIIGKRGAHILYKKTGKFDAKQWVTTLVDYKSGEQKVVVQDFCFT